MPTAEAQRTLVKSPPELWAELSDPASLARHLGDFGEIRIARIEGEQRVEWEAEAASGTVELEPSGWGTRVTLTVVREGPDAAAVAPAEPEPEPQAPTELEAAAEPEPQAPAEPEAAAEPTSEVAAGETPTWRARFARLFRRRGARTAGAMLPAPAEAEQAQVEPEPTPAAEEPPNLAAELAAELARLEETMAAQDAELLSAVLDRLGAAHHRPFSRG